MNVFIEFIKDFDCDCPDNLRLGRSGDCRLPVLRPRIKPLARCAYRIRSPVRPEAGV